MEDVENNSKAFNQLEGNTVYVYHYKGKFALWVKINGIRYITPLYDTKQYSVDEIFNGKYIPIAGNLYRKSPSFHDILNNMIRYPHFEDL
jgi:hypothetical protein